MRIGVLGANFKSSRLEARESLAWACQRQLSLYNSNAHQLFCVVLSTCNRVEIYFSAPDLAEAQIELLHLLKQEIAFPFEHHLYSYFGVDCFAHLVQVTAGLDSAILGETEIQRQVKIAYESTLNAYPLPSCMHYLFQKSLHLGKYIRSRFALDGQGITLPKLLFEKGVERGLQKGPILILGLSQVNQQVISFFQYKKCRDVTICSRTSEKAEVFAKREGVCYLPWDKKEEWVAFPWVIVGVNTPHYIIHRSGSVKTRFICDLSMPRAVDPHVSVELCNMEDLTASIEEQQKSHVAWATLATAVLNEKVAFYCEAFLNREVERKLCV